MRLDSNSSFLDLLYSNWPPVENETREVRKENEIIDLSIEEEQQQSSAHVSRDDGSDDEEKIYEKLINNIIDRSTQGTLPLDKQDVETFKGEAKRIKRVRACRTYREDKKSELIRLKAVNKSFKEELDYLREKLSQLSEYINQLSSGNAFLNTENTLLKERIKCVESENQCLKTSKNELVKEIDRLRKEVDLDKIIVSMLDQGSTSNSDF